MGFLMGLSCVYSLYSVYGVYSLYSLVYTQNSLKKLINNSRRKFKRNTFLISVFICDKDFS